MLGVTTYLSTDISPIPLLWVIPLAIYLLTFIIVFSRTWDRLHAVMIRVLPVLALVLTVVMLSRAIDSLAVELALHFATLFVAAMVCHGELARSRPPARRLTEFYLWVALGGMLGGLFNALLAPVLFRSLVEYPLALVAAVLVTPRPLGTAATEPRLGPADLIAPFAVGVVALSSHALAQLRPVRAVLERAGHQVDVSNPTALVAVAIPGLACLALLPRPRRFGLAIGAVFIAVALGAGAERRVIYQNRNFFGVLRVLDHPPGRMHRLYHGGTLHGAQYVSGTAEERGLALPYYLPTSPIGQVFSTLHPPAHVGVVGLGAGALARYATSGQAFEFFEIDPAVDRIARDPRFFTFLRDAHGDVRVVLGDARLSLVRVPDARYGLLVLDAFSSDAIPIHLITREAIRLYLAKLAPGGVLAFQVTNNYVNLEPVLADVAHAEGLACIGRSESFADITRAERRLGKTSSRWVVMARNPRDLTGLESLPGWRPLPGRADARPWADDYSNLLGAIRW